MNDVCLVLEGTYPDLTGGVSEWVDRLVRGLGEVSFAVANLGEEAEVAAVPAYAQPANLAAITRIGLDPEREDPAPGAAAELPEARLYHALSSGAAGALAARVASERGRPLLLSEHGLAWHEAALGLVAYRKHRYPGPGPTCAATPRAGAVAALAQEAYAAADAVTSVCAANARAQLAAGVAPARCHLIPNPAPLPRAASASAGGRPFRVGLVARVVAIKDVATFLRAAAIFAAERRECEFVVIGPLDHEPEYAQRCRQLAAELEIGEQVVFTGETDPALWYPRLDAVALTSLSEGQPLALLEAMAAGLPVVATTVGGCPELVAGAGLLVPPRNPRATAGALLRLAADRRLRARLGATGRARAGGRHAPEQFRAAYRRLYERLARA